MKNIMISLAENVEVTYFEDECIIYSGTTDKMFGANQVGSSIIQCIDTVKSLKEIVSLISLKCNVLEGAIIDDVHSYIRILEKEKVIVINEN